MKSFHQRVELRNDIQHSSHFIIYIREQERLLVHFKILEIILEYTIYF